MILQIVYNNKEMYANDTYFRINYLFLLFKLL